MCCQNLEKVTRQMKTPIHQLQSQLLTQCSESLAIRQVWFSDWWMPNHSSPIKENEKSRNKVSSNTSCNVHNCNAHLLVQPIRMAASYEPDIVSL